jgi:hypothetical protein
LNDGRTAVCIFTPQFYFFHNRIQSRQTSPFGRYLPIYNCKYKPNSKLKNSTVFGSPYLSSNCEIYPLSIGIPEHGCQKIQNNIKDTIVMARRGV